MDIDRGDILITRTDMYFIHHTFSQLSYFFKMSLTM
eukprot:SAG22_NODE_22480_length_198_cov_17.949495_1_plen_35_part_10